MTCVRLLSLSGHGRICTLLGASMQCKQLILVKIRIATNYSAVLHYNVVIIILNPDLVDID